MPWLLEHCNNDRHVGTAREIIPELAGEMSPACTRGVLPCMLYCVRGYIGRACMLSSPPGT